MDQPLKTFIIYTRSDETAKIQLILHLRPLLNSRMLTIWHDGNILPGEDWEKTIKKELKSSDLVLLLVSANSLNSDFIQSQELKTALERLQDGLTRVVPIIMSPCAWRFDPVVAGLQCLPLYQNQGPKPVSDRVWQNEHEAWTNVVENLGDMVAEINTRRKEAERIEIEQKQRELNEIEDKKRFAALEIERRDAEEKRAQAEQIEKQKRQQEAELESVRLAEVANKEQEEHNRRENAERLRKEEEKRQVAEKRLVEEKQEKQAFDAALGVNSIQALKDYLIRFGPKPIYETQAKEQISRLVQENTPLFWRRHKAMILGGSSIALGLIIYLIFLITENPKKNDPPITLIKPNREELKNDTLLAVQETKNDTQNTARPEEVKFVEKYTSFVYPDFEKMKVVYIGVDNPITINSFGVNPSELKVTSTGANISVSSAKSGKYIIRAISPGEGYIKISGGGLSPLTYNFRVKRMPDPVPLLGAQHRSKPMTRGEFKAQGGIAAVLENFDFEAKCDMLSFEAIYLPIQEEPITKQNIGAKWNSDIQELINKAKPGDAYFFDDIKVKCPGDLVARNLNCIAFKIK